jgi:hypothetical protein
MSVGVSSANRKLLGFRSDKRLVLVSRLLASDRSITARAFPGTDLPKVPTSRLRARLALLGQLPVSP